MTLDILDADTQTLGIDLGGDCYDYRFSQRCSCAAVNDDRMAVEAILND